MAKVSFLDGATAQNLRDAGCDDTFIERFARIAESTKDQLDLLSTHRASLLHSVHENQKRIDCLDYLIYKIKKQ